MESKPERKIDDIENLTVRGWVRDYIERKWKEADDPVAQKVIATTAKDFVAWLVWYKGLPEDTAENVESNLREMTCHHRLQGRLDNVPWLGLLAQVWGLRQDVKELKQPQVTGAKDA